VLGTMMEQLNSMVATLQTINDEQQSLTYKIEAMARMRSTSERTQLLSLPSIQPPTPTSVVAPSAPVTPADVTDIRVVHKSLMAPQPSGLLKPPPAAEDAYRVTATAPSPLLQA
jgi:hypothetical protein